MIRRFLWLILLLLALHNPAHAYPVTVVDARGVRMTERAAPRRIVSLTPAVTEMLFALGLGSRVVGDTVYCDFPPAARRIAKIGDLRVNYERVVALRPDLIVGDVVATSSAVARLTELHLPVFAVRPDSINAVEDSLHRLGQVTGADQQAQIIIAQMRAKRRAAQTLAARDPRRPKVLIVTDTNPLFVAGRGTFMDDIVTEAGGINAAALRGYGSLSREAILSHPPDIILANAGDQAALRADPALRLLSAVRVGRFISVTDHNLLVRPGPRVADGLLQVAHALHPGTR